MKLLFSLPFFLIFMNHASGHGYMKTPSNRASLWRVNWTEPAYYNDNEFFCGGFLVQYELNGGKCGVCGDNYSDPRPRSNENTGTWGQGVIAETYQAGSVIDVTISLDSNHMGSFSYSLCVLKDSTKPEEEDCFQPVKLADGSDAFILQGPEYDLVYNKVQLPKGLTCDRCVLRWHYKVANSWGVCEDGTGAIGCGDQETFRSCSDIRIV